MFNLYFYQIFWGIFRRLLKKLQQHLRTTKNVRTQEHTETIEPSIYRAISADGEKYTFFSGVTSYQ